MAKTAGEGGGARKRPGLVGDNVSSPGKVTVKKVTTGKAPKVKTGTGSMKRTPTKPRY